jgi:hypothetical protein
MKRTGEALYYYLCTRTPPTLAGMLLPFKVSMVGLSGLLVIGKTIND